MKTLKNSCNSWSTYGYVYPDFTYGYVYTHKGHVHPDLGTTGIKQPNTVLSQFYLRGKGTSKSISICKTHRLANNLTKGWRHLTRSLEENFEYLGSSLISFLTSFHFDVKVISFVSSSKCLKPLRFFLFKLSTWLKKYLRKRSNLLKRKRWTFSKRTNDRDSRTFPSLHGTGARPDPTCRLFSTDVAHPTRTDRWSAPVRHELQSIVCSVWAKHSSHRPQWVGERHGFALN